MEDLIIFSSALNCILLALIAVIHIGAATLSAVCRYRLYTDSAEIFRLLEIGAILLEGVGIVLHLIILWRALLGGAEADEILLTLLVSGAAALISLYATDRIFKSKKEKKG